VIAKRLVVYDSPHSSQQRSEAMAHASAMANARVLCISEVYCRQTYERWNVCAESSRTKQWTQNALPFYAFVHEAGASRSTLTRRRMKSNRTGCADDPEVIAPGFDLSVFDTVSSTGINRSRRDRD
jgi:hypothetical protein